MVRFSDQKETFSARMGAFLVGRWPRAVVFRREGGEEHLSGSLEEHKGSINQ